MNARTTKTAGIFGAATMAMAGFSMDASAALDPSDPSIINLYLLNDQAGSTPFNNAVNNSFLDTAPTIGTPPGSQPQHHEDASSAPSPTWVSTPGIGTGTGLDFEKDNLQNTRFRPWMHETQGNYSNGESFTVMGRIKMDTMDGNSIYAVTGHSSNHLAIEGISAGAEGRVNVRVRDGGGAGGETFWDLNTTAGLDNEEWLTVLPNTWYNVFMIYDANASLTIAIDDGTTFQSLQTTAVPSDFDTLTNGFADAGAHWGIGTTGVGASPVNPFDGEIESVVIWDKALSLPEADAIGLTNVPEPASAGATIAGLALLVAARRQRRTA